MSEQRVHRRQQGCTTTSLRNCCVFPSSVLQNPCTDLQTWQPSHSCFFIFVFFFVVYKEIVKGEEKYRVIGFYTTGGGAIHGDAHLLYSYCAIHVPCAAAALERRLRARFSLRLAPCDLPLQASHHTCCQSSLFVARVINTLSSALNVLGIRELFMLTIIL